jgi:hypothetical protein
MGNTQRLSCSLACAWRRLRNGGNGLLVWSYLVSVAGCRGESPC